MLKHGGIVVNSTLKEEVSIVLSGEAGQGIQTIESLLTYILKRGVLCFRYKGIYVSN